MSTYVITPRTEAECNQLRSILHSTGRTVSEIRPKPIRVGEAVTCFDSIETYHTDVARDDVLTMINPVHLQVNQLSARLPPLNKRVQSVSTQPVRKPITAQDIRVGLVVYPKDSYEYSSEAHTISTVDPDVVDWAGKGEVKFANPTDDGYRVFSFDYLIEHFEM